MLSLSLSLIKKIARLAVLYPVLVPTKKGVLEYSDALRLANDPQ